jgi:hypothetical protein
MATTNLDSADLKAVAAGGWIHEDVMDAIWDVTNIPLPFTDRAASGSCSNSYTEWNKDALRAPDLANARVDGADTNTTNDTNTGSRKGNHCQISTKTVQVSERAQSSDTMGSSDALAYQIMQRQRELRRDREAIMLSNQGSIADDGATIAGKMASIFAQTTANSSHGATGSTPGFSTGTKLFGDVVAGTKRAMTETVLRDTVQNVYLAGGPDGRRTLVLMARPENIRKISEYGFTSTARVATVTSPVSQDDRGGVTLQGAVNVFITDFGTLEMIPNRLQPTSAANTSHVGIFDFEYIDVVLLSGYETIPLAKTGLADKRSMAVDGTLRLRNEDSCGVIYDVDQQAAMVA